MIDLIKKTVLAGIGATVITKEKIEAGLSELVRQGKVSAQEASEAATRIAEEGRREFESTRDDLGEKVRELLARADFASKARVDALELRVRSLEERLAALAALQAPPAPPLSASGPVA